MRSRATIIGAALTIATSALLGTAQASPATTQQHTAAAQGATYVALGDSYSAGEGLGPFQKGTAVPKGKDRNECHRSVSYAYSDLTPAVVLPGVANRAFWACSGAHASEMTTGHLAAGEVANVGQPIQVKTVGPATKYISISAGGNDVGFGDLGKGCAKVVVDHLPKLIGLPGASCAQQIKTSTAELPTLRKTLVSLYTMLLTRAAPGVILAVVGYPRVFPASYNGLPTLDGSSFCVLDHYPVTPLGLLDVGMPETDAKKLDAFIVSLDQTIQAAIADTVAAHPSAQQQLRYADAYSVATAHNCRGTTPHATVTAGEISPALKGVSGKGVVGKLELALSSATFHPTQEGQRLFAHTVQRTFLTAPPRQGTPPTPAPVASPVIHTSGTLANTIAYVNNVGVHIASSTSNDKVVWGEQPFNSGGTPDLVWSPDGRYLAFSVYHAGDNDLYEYDTAGGGLNDVPCQCHGLVATPTGWASGDADNNIVLFRHATLASTTLDTDIGSPAQDGQVATLEASVPDGYVMAVPDPNGTSAYGGPEEFVHLDSNGNSLSSVEVTSNTAVRDASQDPKSPYTLVISVYNHADACDEYGQNVIYDASAGTLTTLPDIFPAGGGQHVGPRYGTDGSLYSGADTYSGFAPSSSTQVCNSGPAPGLWKYNGSSWVGGEGGAYPDNYGEPSTDTTVGTSASGQLAWLAPDTTGVAPNLVVAAPDGYLVFATDVTCAIWSPV